jgi:hypothetical protein
MNAPRNCSANFGHRLVSSRLSQCRLQGAMAPICSARAGRCVVSPEKATQVRIYKSESSGASSALQNARTRFEVARTTRRRRALFSERR